MKTSLRTALVAFLALSGFANAREKPYSIQEGDVVFSSSPIGQGQAVIDATQSIYTHCGIVFVENGKWMVLEAVEPVGVTTLKDFESRSTPGTFLAKRLKSPVAPAAYQTARNWAKAQIGLKYDLQFRWDDERMYCSELVWKVFEKAGVKLCEPNRFQDYLLDKPSVRKIIVERYGSIDRIPKDEPIVAPSDLAKSSLLVEVPRQP